MDEQAIVATSAAPKNRRTERRGPLNTLRLKPETGLYYYRARYYSPKLGRFLQTDPVGIEDDLNLYAYANHDAVNSVDPTGELSFVVARQILGGKLPGVGHAFVVTYARYYGDPDAKIRSLGPLANGKMGNISDPTRAAESAKTTARDDYSAWVVMGARGETDNVSQILAPDSVVDAVAEGVQENKTYAALPERSDESNEVNSNSGAFAVGDTSEQIASGDPNAQVDRTPFNLILPGQAASDRVEINTKKVTCTGSRIKETSC